MRAPAAPERAPEAPRAPEAAAEWRVWGVTARVVTDEPALPTARRIAETELAAVTTACSRFVRDSELARVNAGPRPAGGVELSPLLAEFVAVALDAAVDTEGAVDPTLGADLLRLGYDRDFERLAEGVPAGGLPVSIRRRRPGWQRTVLEGRRLLLPAGLLLDLGATAKAHAADRIARRIAEETGSDALVSLGGDIATAGSGGRRWEILVQDVPGDPAQRVSLPTGSAVATSSTQKRRWRAGGATRHHILDPRLGLPADPVWRSVSVAARRCLVANTLSTAAIVKGRAAPGWLSGRAADARLVGRDGAVVSTGAWPVETPGRSEAPFAREVLR